MASLSQEIIAALNEHTGGIYIERIHDPLVRILMRRLKPFLKGTPVIAPVDKVPTDPIEFRKETEKKIRAAIKEQEDRAFSLGDDFFNSHVAEIQVALTIELATELAVYRNMTNKPQVVTAVALLMDMYKTATGCDEFEELKQKKEQERSHASR